MLLNVTRAVSTVYTISTGANWNQDMFAAIDATEVGQGPSRNFWPSLGLYFIILILLGRYLIVTLMTAIFVDAFEKSNIKAQILAKDASHEDAWQVRGRGKPRRQELPKVDSMFDPNRLEADSKRVKLSSLWNALHVQRLRLSDFEHEEELHHSILDLKHSAMEALHHASATMQQAAHHASETIHHAADAALHRGHHHPAHKQDLSRLSLAEQVARAVGHGKSLTPRKVEGVDYLGTIWYYTTALGSWRQRRAYHKKTILMLCGVEHRSARPSAVDRFVKADAGEAAAAAPAAASAGEDILEFALIPGANLELIHSREFEALEGMGVPCTSVFTIRVSMPFPDLSHRNAANMAHMTATKFRNLTREEEGDHLAHGIELYVCPETGALG